MTALIDPELMRTFVAICEGGSFRAAAERVNRSPSAISMQMTRLEELMARPLFAKNGRSVALSPDGEELLGYARRILSLNEEAVARFRSPQLGGRVRFGAPDDYETRLMPAILARFGRLCPDADIELVLAPSAVLMADVAAGELDLAFVFDGHPGAPAGSEVIHAEPFVWLGCAGGDAKRRRPLPVAVPGGACPWRHRALEALDRDGLPYRIVFSCEYSHGQLAALQADLAVSPLPASYLLAGLERIAPEHGLPDLGIVATRLVVSPRANDTVRALARVAREVLQPRLAG